MKIAFFGSQPDIAVYAQDSGLFFHDHWSDMIDGDVFQRLRKQRAGGLTGCHRDAARTQHNPGACRFS